MFFFSLFSTCGTNRDWPESTRLHTYTITYVKYSLFLTHTHHLCTHHTVYTSLPSASNTSPRWSPVCASTWHVNGPTGRSQFPLTGNTGGSMWTTLSLSNCLMVRLNECSSLFVNILQWMDVPLSDFSYLAIYFVRVSIWLFCKHVSWGKVRIVIL